MQYLNQTMPYLGVSDEKVTIVGGGGGAGYTVDASSGKPIPQNLSEFDAMLAEIGIVSGGPSHAYLVGQATASPINDIIGSKNLTDVTAGGPATVSWAQARAGWSSTFLMFTAGSGAHFANGTFGNVNTDPYLVIARTGIDVTSITRTVMHFGDFFDDDAAIEAQATPRIQYGEGFGAGRRLGTFDPIAGTDVITLAQLHDPGARKASMVYTSQEKIDSAYGGSYANGTTFGIGGDNTNTWFPPTMSFLDVWIFTGSAAQKTMPEIRAIMAKLDNVAIASYPKFSWNMVKTAAGVNYDAGARTVETWSGDVYVETTCGYTGDVWAIGLGADDPDQDYATMDFAVLNDSGAMYAYANGVGTNLGIVPAIGEVYRVAREGTAVKIYKDGVAVHTFGTTSSGAIHVDTAIRIQNSTIRSIRVVADGTEQDITWTNIVNAVVY